MRLIDLLPLKELQPLKEMENPCWKGYQMVGTKKKNGREVPNCVPNNEAIDSYGASQPGGYFGDDADEKDIKEDDKALRDNPELRDTDDEVEYGSVEPDEYDVEDEDDMKDFIKFMRAYVAELNEATCPCMLEAEYQGRDVPLGKPMQGDVKKFKVYVKNPAGNVVKVNFGDPNMRIKKSNPARRKSFRARHNCDNPGPRTKARYWSCRKW